MLLSPAALAVLGLIVGSFLNVVVHRLPLMLERQWWGDVAAQLGDADSHRRVFQHPAPERLAQAASLLDKALEGLAALGLARPASRCPACGHRIRWHENIPVVSWLALRGKCSACGTRISMRYPMVEVGTAALFAAAAWRFGAQPATLMWCAVLAVLLALALIDWDTTVLPDNLTLPLLWAGLIAAALGWLPELSITTSVWGAVAGYLSLYLVYLFFKLVTGKEGMGFGDFKLLAALGAWLGWQAILPIVLMASVLGAAVGLVMKATGSLREGRFVPFGPFLAGGGVVVMLVGLPTVLGWIGQA
ncbi:prepilin peptidase [Rubrivivax rivuli]|uniref:Prepilin leader peptidase/N-methyltransferase n=1 Tax=Rubrivivax rivuli TaxID=1862385 RepID=A0A437R967_9BURK|nr:A24 family peptidase [Rubrivivax rivuli]RVU43336.1 prepilin peptidase [Rubrivivax rivuli]